MGNDLDIRVRSRAVIITAILDESEYGYKVRLKRSGREVWLRHEDVLWSEPKRIFIPNWRYEKEIAPLEDIPDSEPPFQEDTART